MNNIELENYIKLIHEHAWVALKKIKKPTSYEFEDLVNEGVEVFLRARKNFESNQGATFKTVLIRFLRNHFCDIVKRSYVQSKTFTSKEQEKNYRKHLERTQEKENPVNQAHIRLLFSELEPIEKDYIKAVVLSMSSPLSRKREEVRKLLNLSEEEEMKIRMKLLVKIHK